MKKQLIVVAGVFLFLVGLLSTTPGPVIYSEKVLDLMVDGALQTIDSNQSCLEMAGGICSVIIYLGDDEMAELIARNIASDKPQEGTITYGYMFENRLRVNGYNVIRYFAVNGDAEVGVTLERVDLAAISSRGSL